MSTASSRATGLRAISRREPGRRSWHGPVSLAWPPAPPTPNQDPRPGDPVTPRRAGPARLDLLPPLVQPWQWLHAPDTLWCPLFVTPGHRARQVIPRQGPDRRICTTCIRACGFVTRSTATRDHGTAPIILKGVTPQDLSAILLSSRPAIAQRNTTVVCNGGDQSP